MKNLLINNCMNYIKKNNNYNNIKLKEIEYGLVSIYLTLSKIIIILIIAYFLGIIKEVFIFMALFNILRAPAFGLHATKSWICLLSSTLVFICVPELCIHLKLNIYIKLFVCFLGIIFMFKNAPADTYKRPIINKKRRRTFKIISTSLTIIFSIVSILLKNTFVSNCLLFCIILENALISPLSYKLFKLPYNNYITYLKNHPDLTQ